MHCCETMKPLVGNPGVLQAERHDFVIEQSLTSDEWRLLSIKLKHLDLVVS